MKTAIIIVDKAKQVVFVPENETDRGALKMFSPKDNIQLVVKEGTFGERESYVYGYNIDFCRGGYLRPFDNRDALMLVLTPKEPESNPVEVFREELLIDMCAITKDLSEEKQKQLTEFIENYTPRR